MMRRVICSDPFKGKRKVAKWQRVKTGRVLSETYPNYHLWWCGSHFFDSGLFIASTLDGRYIWFDSDVNPIKKGTEIDGTIEGYP